MREIFALYAKGELSILDLAEHLNELGFQPRSKRGITTFGQKTVRGMPSNRFYVGDIVYKGEVVAAGLHEPIIDRELFDRVQQVRERKARHPQRLARGVTKRPYLLRGIATCAQCGSPMWANTNAGGKYNYYRCSARVRGEPCDSKATGVRAEVPEGMVSEMFANWKQPHDWAARIGRLPDDPMGPTLEDERERLEQRRVRLRRAMTDQNAIFVAEPRLSLSTGVDRELLAEDQIL